MQKKHAVMPLSTLIVLCLLSGATLAMISDSVTFQASGTIAAIGVEVYKDADCQTELTTLEWGTVYPGAVYNCTVYVKNPGTIAALLSMSTSNWNPQNASSILTVNWNCTGYVLPAENSVAANITLTVPEDIATLVAESTTFSFDVTITGTQQ
jgi:hypothetical protein